MPSQETFRDVQTSKAVNIGVEKLKSWGRKKSCVLGRKKKKGYSHLLEEAGRKCGVALPSDFGIFQLESGIRSLLLRMQTCVHRCVCPGSGGEAL